MNESVCELAYEVNNNAWIILVWSIVVFLNTTGILATIHVTRLLLCTQVEVFHINLRIMFSNLSLGLILRSAFTLFRAMQQIVLAITWQDKCDFVQDVYKCSVQSRINLTPFNSVIYTYLAVALERSFATLTYRNYEKRRNEIISLALAVATWIHPVVELVNTINRPVKGQREREYCSALTAQPVVLSQVFNNQIIICLICLIIFAGIWRFCVKKSRLTLSTQHHNLSSRFQLAENIRASKIILPNAILFSIITLLNILFMFLLEISKQSHSIREFAIFKETMSLTVPVYINVYAWIFIIRCPQFAKRTYVVRRFPQLTKQSPQAEIKGPNHHFSMLTGFWTSTRG
ncbi:hypothetical protein QR680_000709 [Steinernema hermaphroditum]|uniref:G-protein coupled receptors family 1 profile domain-containing protein n=1 Tax=Steinernema hermaphroditum TaxID=289476 RepID=A0AA39GX41_9BILA|nr:hypothetical protein QR680_000709 [Steinernema hermaphroditum]